MPGRPLRVLGACFILLALSFPASRGTATEEFARETGRACGECHLDPSGGGELTPGGKSFLAWRQPAGRPGTEGPGRRALRFAAGLLHLATAVLWFGTILYVHLLLKPAYAARGLPRGELLVGWGSIVSIAVTGAVLTLLRVPSFDAMYRTRFGILLSVKIFLYLVMVATAVLVTFVVGPRLKGRRTAIEPGRKDLSAEELGQFDGKEGRPAYVGYRGSIYDVTGSRLWTGGSHVGKHPAGMDLSDALKHAPHGEDRVLAMPAVGTLLASGGAGKRPFHERGFYFMTYLNLGLVLGILLIIALWRWG